MKKSDLEIYEILKSIIPNPICELDFRDNFQLLIAVILSAQCTDKRVNLVTKDLFQKYDTPYKLASANLTEVEEIIKPCGFFHNKAKNIIEASRGLVEYYDGVVPSDMDKLMALNGVGRKTANVVRAVGFNIPSMPVDTHVHRLSGRLGLSDSKDVKVVEEELCKCFDEKYWNELHHLLILFGRYYCKAISPKCVDCPLKKYCSYKKENKK